jgi:hypothetical protein
VSVFTFGALLLVSALGLGLLGMVKRGYELLIVMTMGLLVLLGVALMAKGLLG